MAGVSSALLHVECHRTLDRYWLQGEITEAQLIVKRAAVDTIVSRLEIVTVDATILNIAAQPLPVILGTLDAIHLASALAYRSRQPADERPILFATHDRALAKAAVAMHFEVIGVAP